MPWFKVSDDWATHPKTISAGRNARSLWFTSGNLMAKAATDGVVPAAQHKLYASLAEVPWKANAARLVEVRFWHVDGNGPDGLKRCTDCQIDIDNIQRHRVNNDLPRLEIGPNDLYWHAWAFHQLPKHRQMSPEAKAADDRDRALRRDSGLCQEIQKRDGSLCRFCGIRVDWRHRKGRHRATYDHLDPRCFTPNGGNFIEDYRLGDPSPRGVVTSCGPCNEEKNGRTAAEWVADGGHTLKPPGWKAGDPDPTRPDAIWPGSDPDLAGTPLKSDLGSDPGRGHGRADARLGPGQIGLDPGPDPGRVGAGRVGLGGDGPGLAGLVRSGAAGAGSGPSPATDVSAATDAGGADPDPATDVTREVQP